MQDVLVCCVCTCMCVNACNCMSVCVCVQKVLYWAIPLFNCTPLWMTINGVQGGGELGICEYVPGG